VDLGDKTSINVSHTHTHIQPPVFIIIILLLIIVNTKAEVRFHLDSAEWLSEKVKGRVRELVRHTQ